MDSQDSSRSFQLLRIVTNWAGYAIDCNNGYSATVVNGVVKIPQLQSESQGFLGYWVGFDGYSNGVLEQTGIDCYSSTSNPNLQYFNVFYTILPEKISGSINLSPNNEVSIGDTVSLQAIVQSSEISFSVKDITTNSIGSATVSESSTSYQGQSAEWIGENVESSYQANNFPSATFSNCFVTINGVQSSINGFQEAEGSLNQIETQMIKSQNCYVPSDLSIGGGSFTLQNSLTTPLSSNVYATDGTVFGIATLTIIDLTRGSSCGGSSSLGLTVGVGDSVEFSATIPGGYSFDYWATGSETYYGNPVTITTTHLQLRRHRLLKAAA